MSVLPWEQDIYPETGLCFTYMRHSNGWSNALNRSAWTAAQQPLSSVNPHLSYCHAVEFPDGLRIQSFKLSYLLLPDLCFTPLKEKLSRRHSEGIHSYFTYRRSSFSSRDPLVALTEVGDLPISWWLCFIVMTKQHILPEPMNLRSDLISIASG